MGQPRNLIKNFDASEELGQTQRELVENLAKLAESKAQFFELEISTSLRTAGSPDNQTLPVESVLASETYTHAMTADSVAKIGDNVIKSLKKFCPGSQQAILDGVGGLITDTLTTFLGEGSASTETKKEYYVLTEGNSIVRVDLLAWYLSVESKAITDKMSKVTAFVAVKSAVDIEKIKFNTFLNLYQAQLTHTTLPEATIDVALEEARKIYNKFRQP